MLLMPILGASIRGEVRRRFDGILAGPEESGNLLCGKKKMEKNSIQSMSKTLKSDKHGVFGSLCFWE